MQRIDSADFFGRWQLFPPLSAEEERRLEEDIREHGVLLPVEVDRATGAVLDGLLPRDAGLQAEAAKKMDSLFERRKSVAQTS